MAVFIVSTLGAVCPCPRTTGRGRNSPVHSPGAFLVVFLRLNRPCASGVATPVTVHPDSSEDRESSTNAVP